MHDFALSDGAGHTRFRQPYRLNTPGLGLVAVVFSLAIHSYFVGEGM